MDDKTKGPVWVKLGEYSQATSDPHEITLPLKNVHIHPDYDKWTLDYDVALFELAFPVPASPCIGIACLPDEHVPTGSTCFVTGWGDLTNSGGHPDKLQEIPVATLTSEDCSSRYNQHISDRMLCATGNNSEGQITDACWGDSGGPLVCESQGRYVLHGIVSWGYVCASQQHPGVYARVYELRDYIDSTMAVEDSSPWCDENDALALWFGYAHATEISDAGLQPIQDCGGSPDACDLFPLFKSYCPKTCGMCPVTSCGLLPGEKRFGCSEDGGHWSQLSDTTSPVECREQCESVTADGVFCCFVSENAGCWMKPGAAVTSLQGDNGKSVICETQATTTTTTLVLSSRPPPPTTVGPVDPTAEPTQAPTLPLTITTTSAATGSVTGPISSTHTPTKASSTWTSYTESSTSASATVVTSTTVTPPETYAVSGSLSFSGTGSAERIAFSVRVFLVQQFDVMYEEPLLTLKRSGTGSGRRVSASDMNSWQANYQLVSEWETASVHFERAGDLHADFAGTSASLSRTFQLAGLQLDPSSVVVHAPRLQVATADMLSTSQTSTTSRESPAASEPTPTGSEVKEAIGLVAIIVVAAAVVMCVAFISCGLVYLKKRELSVSCDEGPLAEPNANKVTHDFDINIELDTPSPASLPPHKGGLMATKDDLIVFESPDSWTEVRRLKKGDIVYPADEVKVVNGHEMQPILPSGAVRGSFLSPQELPPRELATSRSPSWLDTDGSTNSVQHRITLSPRGAIVESSVAGLKMVTMEPPEMEKPGLITPRDDNGDIPWHIWTPRGLPGSGTPRGARGNDASLPADNTDADGLGSQSRGAQSPSSPPDSVTASKWVSSSRGLVVESVLDSGLRMFSIEPPSLARPEDDPSLTPRSSVYRGGVGVDRESTGRSMVGSEHSL
jgi:hypothetical protein